MGRIKQHHPRRRAPRAVIPGPAEAGSPVVDEGFHCLHPELAGWNMERWLLAPGDGDPDFGQFAATELQEHLDTSSHVTPARAEALRAGTVTVHYFLRTVFDGDTGLSYCQGVVYSPATGWIAVERPWEEQDEDDTSVPDARAWSAPALDQLLAALGEEMPELRASVDVDGDEGALLSLHLREALTAAGRA
ncbi:hypothetical protein F7Q99_36615 [Streptomyces kaniharaensis]|uniref:Uncharacterized protein n=1 Tax=Streptomyces kaniharaensis TaxID=212423 RepID=A0A6N7L2Y6_9ACTN|nr:hypothetical protein [Streptomyces kaniharaensis]MQS17565.1 hypothetical protein [Streptomyces kaniharaensis]